MDDLISRQAAIDAVSHHGEIENDYTDLYHDGYCDGVYDSVDILEDLPSAQQWIPCSERLPEGNTIVLATTADYMYIVEFEVYSNGHMYWNEVNEYRSIEGVIAWMPLPPSFKEE